MARWQHRMTVGFWLLVCIPAVRAEEPAKQFAHTPLGGSVHLLQGWECNIVVSAGDEGVVMVDTCSAKPPTGFWRR